MSGPLRPALVVALTLVAAEARAQRLEDAAGVFSAAQAAELAGDAERAAELYEAADRLAPTLEARRSAARTRLAAGHRAVAATHAAELLRRYPARPGVEDFAAPLLRELAPSLGRLEVACEPECTLEVGRGASSLGERGQHVLFVAPGAHTLRARFALGEEEIDVEVGPGESRAVSVEGARSRVEAAPPAATARRPAGPRACSPDDDRFGISPGFALVSGGLTLGLLGATIAAGVDVENAAEAYRANPTPEAYRDGLSRELAANVLIAATSVTAGLTVLLAALTDWEALAGGEGSADVALRVGPAAIALRGRLR